ncbi:hypothetical protein KIPB_006292 [Kipferlia bialata]|uniref:RNA helicase n=1 Tax=Kipferlia bialata TaxID=797122 RepID=A0A9K3CYM3_9EUKA|nr:hypothetical protein KIPB_006292 [Kipferlia bialata]|eukprot:g6292.t1
MLHLLCLVLVVGCLGVSVLAGEAAQFDFNTDTATLLSRLEAPGDFLTDPCEIFLDASKLVLHGLVQRYIALEEKHKIKRLLQLLETLHYNQIVIFVNKVQRCRALADVLKEAGNPVTSMHARLRQEERISRYSAFKSGETRIMVSTDLFERGVDFQRTNIVINFDVPALSDTYLHRVGRAGRFGTNGLAITFVSTEEDKALLKEIQDRFVIAIPEVEDVSSIDRSTYMNG